MHNEKKGVDPQLWKALRARRNSDEGVVDSIMAGAMVGGGCSGNDDEIFL